MALETWRRGSDCRLSSLRRSSPVTAGARSRMSIYVHSRLELLPCMY